MRIHGKPLGPLNLEVKEIEIVHSLDPEYVKEVENFYNRKINEEKKSKNNL